MLMPGVGTLTETPTAPVAVRSLGPPEVAELVLAAPPCRLIETGRSVPPMTRKARSPPNDVALLDAPEGFQLDRPTPTSMLPRPSDPRAPKAEPPPASVLGLPKSPLMVMPVPPLGLFHTGMPTSCAATGVAAAPARARTTSARFMVSP